MVRFLVSLFSTAHDLPSDFFVGRSGKEARIRWRRKQGQEW